MGDLREVREGGGVGSTRVAETEGAKYSEMFKISGKKNEFFIFLRRGSGGVEGGGVSINKGA